jgi:Fe-S-cluster-containing dehydrogenase component
MFACNRRYGSGGLAKSAIMVRSSRACPDPPCLKVCPVDALSLRAGGGVVLERSKCIGCKLCVDACPVKAVFWNQEANKPNICVHCGYCVDYCPYDILELKQVEIN